MQRNLTAWLLSVPLSAGGMLLAHQLSWRVESHGESDQAHGYLQYWAILAALGTAILVIAIVTHMVAGITAGAVSRAPSATTFAVVPVIGFLCQEHLEHLVAARELELTFFTSAPFLLGLSLQLPFALAAFLVARFILGLVNVIVRAARLLGAHRAPSVRSVLLVPRSAPLPLRPVLARAGAGRAPPRRSK